MNGGYPRKFKKSGVPDLKQRVDDLQGKIKLLRKERLYSYVAPARQSHKVPPEVVEVPGTHFGDLTVSYLSSGANGVAYLARGSFGTYVVKVPKTTRKDNPIREYLVGMELNEYARYFPSIVKTEAVYGFKGNPENIRDVMSTLKPIAESIHHTLSIKEACENAGHAVLFVHAVAGNPLKSYNKDEVFANHEMLGVLMQIYYTCFMLRKKFTHHDLHCSNVLVHQPNPGKCIKFRFVFNTSDSKAKEVVEVKCSYHAQMVDYGRMYNEKVARMVEEGIDLGECNTRECGKEGENCGFAYRNSSHHYDKRNESQDIRLLAEVYRQFGDHERGSNVLPVELLELCKKVQFGHGTRDSSKRYFTKEQTREKNPDLPKELIFDVKDAIQALGTLCKSSPWLQCQDPVFHEVTVDGVHPFQR